MPATDTPGPPAFPHHVPLAALRRGGVVESVHTGSVAVVDGQGRLLYSAGDPDSFTFTRSALKPFQALPFVAAGGVERFGYSRAQVALLCASHSGEPRHVDAVADMLTRAGNVVEELQCGTHPPTYFDLRGEVPPPPPYSPLAHNCSGKHSGMLAFCVHCGHSKHDYLDLNHPLQQQIRHAVSRFTSTPPDRLVAGVDGCSAPNYAVPLSGLARAFARLVATDVDAEFGRAPKILADAMSAHPEMVSGERRNDLALMQAGRGDWVTKVGAEGVQAIGVRSRGWGIALKVADGSARGLHPATVAVLDQLGLLDAAAIIALAQWGHPTIKNYRGTTTGDIQPLVVLDKLPAGLALGPGP
ncbi:MAG: asparaginase [Betaproteobacteria bacterium]